MDHVKFSEFLGSLETNNCLFVFEPEILDFTENKKEIKLHIHATGGRISRGYLGKQCSVV